MAEVYLAYQPNLKRYVAVKVLPPQFSTEEGFIQRFVREAEIAAALEHPHIVPIIDFGSTSQGLNYVVMRLLRGGTLADRIRERRTSARGEAIMSLGEIAELLNQIAGALDYAHSRGVIHRDIKPNNLMFDTNGTAFLVDFGIAKPMDAAAQMTSPGTSMGTVAYMAPEQWRGDKLTPAIDQYAMGLVIYTLVTGRTAFEVPPDAPYALMNKHVNEMPTPPHLVRPELPEVVSFAIAKAIAKTPEGRFPKVQEFAEAFEKGIQPTGQQSIKTGFFTFPLPPRQDIATPGYIPPPAPVSATPPAQQPPQPAPQPQAPPPSPDMTAPAMSAFQPPAGQPPPSYMPPSAPSPSSGLGVTPLSQMRDEDDKKKPTRGGLLPLLLAGGLIAAAAIVIILLVSRPTGPSVAEQTATSIAHLAVLANATLTKAAESIVATQTAIAANITPLPPGTASQDLLTRVSETQTAVAFGPNPADLSATAETVNVQGTLTAVFIALQPTSETPFTETPPATNTFTPTVTFTPSRTFTATASPTVTPSRTFTPSPTNTPTANLTETARVKAANTTTAQALINLGLTQTATLFTKTPTATFTASPTRTPTKTLTPAPTNTPTNTATPSRTPSPTITPTPVGGGTGKIAFIGIVDGSSDVYLANADGTGVTNLTKNAPFNKEVYAEFSWSPDGQFITFLSDRGGARDLWMISVEGSDLLQITDDGLDKNRPVWSPDGKTIVFDSNRENGFQLWSVDLTTKVSTRLTDEKATIAGPDFFPDGSRILAMSERTGARQFFSLGLDGKSDFVQLTNLPAADNFEGVVSPDGQWIAFRSNLGGQFQIYLVTIEGGDLKTLTNSTEANSVPAWSPDGKQLTFSRSVDGVSTLFIINADGTGERKFLKETFFQGDSFWQPKGK